MSAELQALAWPSGRLGEAAEAASSAAGLLTSSRALELPAPPRDLDDAALSRWLESTAAWLGVEAESVTAPYPDVPAFIRGAAPALVRIGEGDDARFLALVRGGKRAVAVLDPTRKLHEIPVDGLVRAVRAPLDAKLDGKLTSVLDRVRPRRRERTRAALLAERLGATRVDGLWLLRSRPGAELGHLAKRARLPSLLGLLVFAHIATYVLVLLSWAAAARGALQGRFDSGWLIAWVLLLVSLVPFRLLGAWATSRFSIGAGTLLKTRLLAGALRLDTSSIRHQGVGQLLGRVLESSAVETLGVTGGLLSAVAFVEILMTAGLLAQGAGGALHVALYLAITIVAVVVAWRYYRRRRDWTQVRLSMTHDLVERMVGHRTRIAQEPRARWHDGEDQALERYLAASRDLDRASTILFLVPQAWLLLGIAALGPQLMSGSPATVPLAVALGGILLGHQALSSLTNGVTATAGAAIAWDAALPLVRAAGNAAVAPAPMAAATTEAQRRPGSSSVLLHAEDLRFRYRGRAEPVLRGASLRVTVGDRLLLEGRSGGGKSTLGSIITGLRAPDSGLLLLGGLDRHTLGEGGWRRRVVAAPQFHENHVFTSTFAFNLLMGRAWPPSDEDLAEAEAICRELDLGELLDRMPAGLMQMVGETGWQLSHGEKSRLYIARALLQDADLVVLDESFAALDPETLQRALRCVLARSRTLLVIAHP